MSNAGELHVTKKTPLGGVPYGKVVSQILCSDEGKMWWRQFAGPSLVNGQIVSVMRDGVGPSVASLPAKLPPRDLEYTVSDTFAKDGTLYVAAATVEGPQLMRYRLADRKFEDAVPFDDRGSTVLNADGNLTVSKIGVLPDGGLVVLGSRALRTDRKTVRFAKRRSSQRDKRPGRYLFWNQQWPEGKRAARLRRGRNGESLRSSVKGGLSGD